MVGIFRNQDFQFGLSLMLGAVATQQADAGEALAAADRIKDGDADSWALLLKPDRA